MLNTMMKMVMMMVVTVFGAIKMIRLRYCRVQMCPGLNSAPARRVTLDSPVR